MSAGQGGVITLRRPAGADLIIPPLIAGAGKRASRRFVEFFTANIRNKNTREAYAAPSTLSWPGATMRPAWRST